MCRICNIVKSLHDCNIAHQDLHPENIVFSSQTGELDIKLGNFEHAINTENCD